MGRSEDKYKYENKIIFQSIKQVTDSYWMLSRAAHGSCPGSFGGLQPSIVVFSVIGSGAFCLIARLSKPEVCERQKCIFPRKGRETLSELRSTTIGQALELSFFAFSCLPVLVHPGPWSTSLCY